MHFLGWLNSILFPSSSTGKLRRETLYNGIRKVKVSPKVVPYSRAKISRELVPIWACRSTGKEWLIKPREGGWCRGLLVRGLGLWQRDEYSPRHPVTQQKRNQSLYGKRRLAWLLVALENLQPSLLTIRDTVMT